MINWQSILSAFDEKGTLLKWLKQVEAALNNDTLTGAEILTVSPTQIKIKFNFADNTSIESEVINLPAGPQGVAGKDGTNGTNGKDGASITEITTQGSRQVNGYTETEIDVTLSDNPTPKTFTVTAKNGADGAQGATGAAGNGIVSIHTLSHTNDGNETITNIEVVTDEGDPQTFEVHAQNGAATSFKHTVILQGYGQVDGKNGTIKSKIVYITDNEAPFDMQTFLDLYKDKGTLCDIVSIMEDNDDYQNTIGFTGRVISTGLEVIVTPTGYRGENGTFIFNTNATVEYEDYEAI